MDILNSRLRRGFFAELAGLVSSGKISQTAARQIINHAWESNLSARQIINLISAKMSLSPGAKMELEDYAREIV